MRPPPVPRARTGQIRKRHIWTVRAGALLGGAAGALEAPEAGTAGLAPKVPVRVPRHPPTPSGREGQTHAGGPKPGHGAPEASAAEGPGAGAPPERGEGRRGAGASEGPAESGPQPDRTADGAPRAGTPRRNHIVPEPEVGQWTAEGLCLR